ncbi:hypothetical protein L3X38_006783 [Prunus dulcis]|uniref:Uncharacterized protein n=1 Tax=Prunus dulcis TaxID=3755 RepID=A0AAD4ZTG9_PRUDU|nr:hypothetical protein L3X38_006783 [Prunus dulcis]
MGLVCDREICGSLKGKRVGYGGSWCHLTPRLTSNPSSVSYNISGDLGFEELVVVFGSASCFLGLEFRFRSISLTRIVHHLCLFPGFLNYCDILVGEGDPVLN